MQKRNAFLASGDAKSLGHKRHRSDDSIDGRRRSTRPRKQGTITRKGQCPDDEHFQSEFIHDEDDEYNSFDIESDSSSCSSGSEEEDEDIGEGGGEGGD